MCRQSQNGYFKQLTVTIARKEFASLIHFFVKNCDPQAHFLCTALALNLILGI